VLHQSSNMLGSSSFVRGSLNEQTTSGSVAILQYAESRERLTDWANQLGSAKLFALQTVSPAVSWIVVVHPVTAAFHYWEIHLYALDRFTRPSAARWRLLNASSWDIIASTTEEEFRVARIDAQSAKLEFHDPSGRKLGSFGLSKMVARVRHWELTHK